MRRKWTLTNTPLTLVPRSPHHLGRSLVVNMIWPEISLLEPEWDGSSLVDMPGTPPICFSASPLLRRIMLSQKAERLLPGKLWGFLCASDPRLRWPPGQTWEGIPSVNSARVLVGVVMKALYSINMCWAIGISLHPVLVFIFTTENVYVCVCVCVHIHLLIVSLRDNIHNQSGTGGISSNTLGRLDWWRSPENMFFDFLL